MQVKQILDTKGKRVVLASAEMSLRDASQILEKERIGAMVVTSANGDIVGIVSERDIVHAMARHGAAVVDRRVGDVMTKGVVTCAPQNSIDDVMREMTARRFRHLPVLDAGRLAGIISIGDVVKWRLEELEAEASALKEYVASSY